MLQRFGFTPTESRVYQTLLNIGPSTGYAVARELGIARANVYQALESLTRRGAARRAATTPVQYSASGPAAVIANLERSFRHDLAELEDDLKALPIAAGGRADLELITTADQLLSRAASCVDAATAELLAVTGPWAAPLNERFASAVARRVQVRTVALGEPVPDGTTVTRAVPRDQLVSYWGGLPVGVTADRSRAVFGVLLDGRAASGVATAASGAVPFIRHLLRRELTGP